MNIQWIEYGKPWGFGEGDTFTGEGLNKPGTLVKVAGTVYLLGHIDNAGASSGCGCCADITVGEGQIVEAYAVILTMDQFEVPQDTNTED